MDDFWIEFRQDEQDFHIQRHMEHRYQGVLVTQGRVRYTVGEREYMLQKGDLIVLNTLEEHILEVLEYPYARYIFQIKPEFFQSEIKYPEIISIFVSRPPEFSHRCHIPDEMWDQVCWTMESMVAEVNARDTYWKLMAGCGLREIFIPLFRSIPESFGNYRVDANASLVFTAQNYLDQHYVEDISVDELAEHFYVHKSHLSHLFKSVTGYSIMQYVIFLRINKAKAMLLQGCESVSEVAIACGYTDFAHFSKQFRKYENCSPSEYRKRVNQ